MKDKVLLTLAVVGLVGTFAAGMFSMEQTRAGEKVPSPTVQEEKQLSPAPTAATASTEKLNDEKPAENAASEEAAKKPVNTLKATVVPSAAKDWWIPRHDTGVAPQWPRSMTEAIEPFEPIYRIQTQEKVLYLTFDEGYENGYTPKILATLSKEKVPAIFFVTGQFVKSNPELVKEINRLGFGIGNHTQNHPDMTSLSPAKQKEELDKLSASVRQLTNRTLKYYRPPMGRYDSISAATASDLGMRTVFWSIAYKDWEADNQVGTEAALPKVLSQIHPGAIILLHAVSKDNAEMLSQFIQQCRDQGYIFKSLPGEPLPK
ncbi:polysaccharide deacetylase family protein [Heliobacillus mobilis]|uniref:Polysaccharide deacetylase family protein n=1 Tax=Heliobacterium mobile TaxID=28064 RepID=A0A6I3SGN6_HELMO|nr:polysaccharide deacetylase family protein [Heliobacterium mobile]MTV47975.1 polysaccharide deacetylase family protein [Heliobacterium mobile]